MGMGRSSNEELGHQVSRVCRCIFVFVVFLPRFTLRSLSPCETCDRSYRFLTVSRYRLSFCVPLGRRVSSRRWPRSPGRERGVLPGVPARPRRPALRSRPSSSHVRALTNSPRLAAPPRRLQPSVLWTETSEVAPCRQSPSVPRRERLRYCGHSMRKAGPGHAGPRALSPP